MAITTIKSKTTYQTADGKTHNTFQEAQKHEAYLERREKLENTLKKANGNIHNDSGAYSRLLVAIQTNPTYGAEVIANMRGLLDFVQRQRAAAKKA